MLLDIIVPHYNEPLEVVAPFFNILDSQKGVNFDDFRVTMVHNGKVTFGNDDLSCKNLNLVETMLWKPGVSRARNWGIDHAEAEWVCFCDCDDCYSSIFSLMMIFHVLKGENADKFDVIWGSFWMHEENKLSKAESYNPVFIHNKYYRRSFLNEHNIRFNEDIYMSEDSAFNTLVRLEMDPHRLGQINSLEPLYSWCRRLGSITMDRSRWMKNTEGHFERNLYVLDLYRQHLRADSDFMVVRTVTDVYAMINKYGMLGDKEPMLSRIREFYRENKVLYDRVPKEKLAEALKASDRDVCVNAMDISHRPTYEEWLKTIE